MSTHEEKIPTNPECNKNLETFVGAIIDGKKNLARNQERNIGGNDCWNNEFSSENQAIGRFERMRSNEKEDEKPFDEASKAEAPKFAGKKEKAAEEAICGTDVKSGKKRMPQVETGYLTKMAKTTSGESPSKERKNWTRQKQENAEECLKISSMEEEALRERMRNTLLKECTMYLAADGSSRYTKETFRRVFTEKEFLSRIFKLFDQDRDGILVQEEWVEFLKLRLTGEKQIDFAEQVESVAYVLCGEENIDFDKFSKIFNAKGVVDKVFRLMDEDGDGVICQNKIMDFVANLSNVRTRTGLDKESLEWLEKIFRETVGNEKEIRREDFNKILLSKNPFFTDRVFEIFDKDNSGTISLDEFIDAMHQFAGKSPDDKIRFLFKVYDLDGDGLIQHRELQHVMRACMEENGMKFSEDQIEDLTMAMFEDADPHHRGTITYEALKNQLEKHGGLLENLTISIDRWLVPAKPNSQPPSPMRKMKEFMPHQLTRPYMKNNYVFILFVAAFTLLNAILFVSRSIQYGNSNGFVIVARACGQCLNFNSMFVLVLMLRHCITFLRTRGFTMFLPLDQHIYLHKLTGVFIFIFSVIHTIVHLLNFGTVVQFDPIANEKNFTLTEWLLTSKPGLFGLVGGFANPTGVALIIILCIMFVCSQSFVRRGGCFEIFYWTHLLYLPYWILLIFHGPNFWKWFVVPGIIYVIERVIRMVWMRSDRGKTYISSGLLLPSKVTHLVIKRPTHFDYYPGDYVFVNVPAIAKYEWHPFTISSAPEQEDYMWLHIRGVGQWTNRLYEYFDREQEKLRCVQDQLAAAQSSAKKPHLVNECDQSQKTKKTAAISDKEKMPSSRSMSLKKSPLTPTRLGITNEGFDFSRSDELSPQANSEGDISPRVKSYKLAPEKKLQMLLMAKKQPLEKSQSMPDMQTKLKKRERLLALREYGRSESERSFDEVQMRRARLKSLGLAYLSPQNKSLAQSFRYMRNKPTIIAFKTPSLENCDAQISAVTIAQNYSNKEKVAEEGRLGTAAGTSDDDSKFSLTPMNYPMAGQPLEIFIDGPYGAPSSHIFRAQHAVLIATGIGVTPFASILQSIMHRYWKARHNCPRCKFFWASEIPPTVMNLRKVDFFWINRDQRSFEWFVNLLSQLEIEQAELGAAMERFLEMHMYITSALQKTDMKAVGLQLALDLLHEKEKRDLITGLKTRTNAGRPNWDKVFKQLLDQKKGKITVFYCGPPQLARILRMKCDRFGFDFRKEVF